MRRVRILSDYTSVETPNILQIIRDDQGDIHISMVENDEDSHGVRIAADGTRHSLKVRRAFYDLIEAYEKEIEATMDPDIKLINL